MLKDVRDLKSNPINPRKISKAARERLKQSVLLFPEMLSLRDIVINHDNVILCGNQRADVLKEICNSTPMDWMLCMQKNVKWKSSNTVWQEKVVARWKEWTENPTVECTIAEKLSEEEEKELILKDNNEFGEFDYEHLLKICDEVTLVNYGFDEGMFYDPAEEDDVVKKTSLAKVGRKTSVLEFGGNSIAVSKEEYDALSKEYEKYVDEESNDYGFIKYLIDKNRARHGDN